MRALEAGIVALVVGLSPAACGDDDDGGEGEAEAEAESEGDCACLAGCL
jgi:hypothetical protein